MRLELLKSGLFSGRKTTVYNIMVEEEGKTLLDLFIEENIEQYKDEILDIINRIKLIGQIGAQEYFFKLNEGKPGDGVCALFDKPDSKLRLYCIRYGSGVLILGGGGEKIKSIRAWQESLQLSNEANKLIQLSKAIVMALREKDVEWSEDYSELEGDLVFDI